MTKQRVGDVGGWNGVVRAIGCENAAFSSPQGVLRRKHTTKCESSMLTNEEILASACFIPTITAPLSQQYATPRSSGNVDWLHRDGNHLIFSSGDFTPNIAATLCCKVLVG